MDFKMLVTETYSDNEILFHSRTAENNINKSKKINLTRIEIPYRNLELLEDGLDLNETLIDCPNSTFLIRVSGDSMQNAGINDGDILLVDRSKQPKHGNIIIASINKNLTVKRLNYSYKETLLLAENDNYLPIFIRPSDRFEIWGVATMVIKSL